MPWEDLRPALGAARGMAVAVDTPVPILVGAGFFGSQEVESRVLLYGTARRARGASRTLAARAGIPPCMLALGSLAGLPFPRRSLGLVVAPFPDAWDDDPVRMIRRTAGVLADDCILVLHGPLRRSVAGWSRHVASVLGRRRGGLPAEWDVTGWMLRGGFNRILKHTAGRASPTTILVGCKNLP